MMSLLEFSALFLGLYWIYVVVRSVYDTLEWRI